ncbi:MAG: hypothetical protein AB1461_19560 [Thermodesulfobacteriota bacterium]
MLQFFFTHDCTGKSSGPAMAGMVAVPSHLFVVALQAAARHFLWLAPTPSALSSFREKQLTKPAFFSYLLVLIEIFLILFPTRLSCLVLEKSLRNSEYRKNKMNFFRNSGNACLRKTPAPLGGC